MCTAGGSAAGRGCAVEGLLPEGDPGGLPRQQREPQPRAVIGGGTCGSPHVTSWLHIGGWDIGGWDVRGTQKGFGNSCCVSLGSAVMRWPGAHISCPSVLPVSVTPLSRGGGARGPQAGRSGLSSGVISCPGPPLLSRRASAQKLSFWDPCKWRNKGQLSPRE